MKIGLVSFAGNDQVGELGGPNPPVPSLAAALTAHDHQVTVYARRRHPSLMASGAEVCILPAGQAGAFDEQDAIAYVGDFVEQLGTVLRDNAHDVVHSHGWLAGLATHLANQQKAVPTVHTFHRLHLLDELDSARAEAGSRPRTERTVALHADHLIATSTVELEVLVRAGVSRDRISVVPPGVDCRTTDTPEAEPDTPAGNGRPPGTYRLVAFGPPTRVAKIVHALVALPTTELLLAGEARRGGRELRALAARLSVADRLRVPAGSVDPVELIRAADTVICLGSSATMGDEALLAMAHGVPVVAGTPVAAEAVVDGVTGLHAINAAPAELARLLRELLGNEARRQGMGVASLDRALSRYTWARIAEETARVYRHVVGEDAEEPGAGEAAPSPRAESASDGTEAVPS